MSQKSASDSSNILSDESHVKSNDFLISSPIKTIIGIDAHSENILKLSPRDVPLSVLPDFSSQPFLSPRDTGSWKSFATTVTKCLKTVQKSVHRLSRESKSILQPLQHAISGIMIGGRRNNGSGRGNHCLSNDTPNSQEEYLNSGSDVSSIMTDNKLDSEFNKNDDSDIIKQSEVEVSSEKSISSLLGTVGNTSGVASSVLVTSLIPELRAVEGSWVSTVAVIEKRFESLLDIISLIARQGVDALTFLNLRLQEANRKLKLQGDTVEDIERQLDNAREKARHYDKLERKIVALEKENMNLLRSEQTLGRDRRRSTVKMRVLDLSGGNVSDREEIDALQEEVLELHQELQHIKAEHPETESYYIEDGSNLEILEDDLPDYVVTNLKIEFVSYINDKLSTATTKNNQIQILHQECFKLWVEWFKADTNKLNQQAHSSDKLIETQSIETTYACQLTDTSTMTDPILSYQDVEFHKDTLLSPRSIVWKDVDITVNKDNRLVNTDLQQNETDGIRLNTKIQELENNIKLLKLEQETIASVANERLTQFEADIVALINAEINHMSNILPHSDIIDNLLQHLSNPTSTMLRNALNLLQDKYLLSSSIQSGDLTSRRQHLVFHPSTSSASVLETSRKPSRLYRYRLQNYKEIYPKQNETQQLLNNPSIQKK